MNVVPVNAILPLQFFISSNNVGIVNQTPTLLIQKTSDNTYFNGAGYSGTPVPLSMVEVDSTNQPGLYTYTFDRDGDTSEQNYDLYFSNTGVYAGNAVDSIYYSNTGAQLQNALLVAQAVASKMMVDTSIKINTADIASQTTLLDVQGDVDNIEANGAKQSTLVAFRTEINTKLDNILSIIQPVTGSNTVIVHVQDQDLNPIPDVQITFKNSGNTITLAMGRTDSNGDLTLALPNGVFHLFFLKAFVQFPTMPYEITVTGNQTFTIDSTTFQPTAPSPSLCASYIYLVDASGRPITNVVFRAKLVKNFPYSPATATLGTKDWIEVLSDGSGYVQIDLLRGATYEFSCPDTYFSVTNYVVPDQASLDLSTLIPLNN